VVDGGRMSRLRFAAAYVAMIVVAAVAYFAIRSQGLGLVPAMPVRAEPTAGLGESALAAVLLALAVITIVARALGAAFERWLGQPRVIGEIVAGIVLGPSVLGAISPRAYALLLPSDAAGYLGLLAKVGVVLFMFLVGLELNPSAIRKASRATLAISHASILVPFLLGSLLALGLYTAYGTADVGFTTFSLFLGISLSVTAFPVLARILRDWRVQNTELGVMALACAAVNDATAWTLLALVVGVANGQLATAALTLPAVAGYLAVMILVVRPLLKRLSAREESREGPLEHATLAMVFVAMLISAWMTESIGIHALFGAFLLGALVPHDGRLATDLRMRLEDVVVVLFLPAFFAFTGMRTQLGLLSSWSDWGWCAVIIAVATLGKVGGSAITARLNGMDARASAAIGILMNTRGLMELIVLNIGLDLGVITPTLFAMLVLMAIATTFATSPLLRWFVGKEVFEERRAA
jgi:Kef-type K+ transport system membrane component KefB